MPLGATLMSGSPYTWIGSTTRGTPNLIAPGRTVAPEAGVNATARAVAPTAVMADTTTLRFKGSSSDLR